MKLAAISGPAWWPTMSLRQKHDAPGNSLSRSLFWYCWWFRNPAIYKPLGMMLKPCKSWDFNYLFPQLGANRRISEPSTVSSNQKNQKFGSSCWTLAIFFTSLSSSSCSRQTTSGTIRSGIRSRENIGRRLPCHGSNSYRLWLRGDHLETLQPYMYTLEE